MGIDNVNHLIFSTCSNKTMFVLDIEMCKVIASVTIGEGTLSIINRSTQGEFKLVVTVPAQEGTRAMTVDTTMLKG